MAKERSEDRHLYQPTSVRLGDMTPRFEAVAKVMGISPRTLGRTVIINWLLKNEDKYITAEEKKL